MRSATRASMRKRFTPELWAVWLTRLNGPDPTDLGVKRLSAGITQFRDLLAEQDALTEKRFP